ncbi:DUF6286 domain-containing protein [Streptomyces sp. NPDC048639]|uniref:DUF6286 domain-containing protein n=1 Tax=Streptomyces sp. NPDC048639 TaxID=3365581 RepID=UPI0037122FB0
MSDHEPDAKGAPGTSGSTQRMPTVERDPGSGGDSGPGRGSGSGSASGGGADLEQSSSAADYEGASGNGKPRRFWSERRVPAGIVAAIATAALGLALYDVAAVRAGRTAMEWRRRLADGLAQQPLDDGWMIGGAAAATVIGLWLLLLVATPGLRALLTMRKPSNVAGADDVRAGLQRAAAALVLRDRAMEVSGVQSVRVGAGRRRVKVRATAHFRDLDEVRTDLGAALAVGLDELGLVRPLALSVHVRRPAKR